MKKTLTLLSILIFTVTFGQTVQDYQKVADSLNATKNQDEFINYFENELVKYPNNQDVLYWLGLGCLDKQDYVLSEKYFNEALLVNPDFADCYLNLGRIYSMKGDLNKALVYFEKVEVLDTLNAILHIEKAIIKEKLGDKFGALNDLNRAVEKAPNDPETHIKRAEYYINLGFASLAEPSLTKAIDLDPENYISYFNRAKVYCELKRFDDAMFDIQKAIDLDSSQVSLYAIRGLIYDGKQEHEMAINDFTKVILSDNDDSKSYIKVKMGDNFEALNDLIRAIENAPNSLEAQNSRAEYYTKRAEYYINLGFSLLAEPTLTKAIELDPNNYLSYFARAKVYCELKRFDDAMFDIQKAIDLDSSQVSLYTVRGLVYDGKQEHEKAINDFNKVILANSDDLTTYRYRAIAFYNYGLIDEAYKDYLFLKTAADSGLISDQLFIYEVNSAMELIGDSSKTSYYLERGAGYLNLNECQEALEINELGLRKFQNYWMFLYGKATALACLEQYQEAIEYFELALVDEEIILMDIKNNPEYALQNENSIYSIYANFIAKIHYGIAHARADIGQFSEALIEINIAIKLALDKQSFFLDFLYNFRGYIYLLSHKYKKAIADFNRSLACNSYYSDAYVNRAIAMLGLINEIDFISNPLSGNLNFTPIDLNWSHTNESAKIKSMVLSAVMNCNWAIEADKSNGYAYYIRGQIQRAFVEGDGCSDFLTANSLGYLFQKELLQNCGR